MCMLSILASVLTIYLDMLLGELLHKYYPDKNFSGLVPTMPDWIFMESERQFVLERYYLQADGVRFPILMCPDDCDLWCTLIITDVVCDEDFVIS